MGETSALWGTGGNAVSVPLLGTVTIGVERTKAPGREDEDGSIYFESDSNNRRGVTGKIPRAFLRAIMACSEEIVIRPLR